MDDFKRNSVLMLVLTTTASGINYLCQIAMGRILSVASFGIMNSMFSVILVLSVPGTSLNMMTAKQVASSDGSKQEVAAIAYKMVRLCIQWGMGLFTFIVLTSTISASLLRTSHSLILLTGAAVVVSFLPYVLSGVLSGMRLFFVSGILTIVPPLFKAVGVLLAAIMPLGDTVKMNAIMGMIVLGYIAALIGYYAVFYRRHDSFSWKILWQQKKGSCDKSVLFIMAANFAYLLLINADIMFISVFLDSQAAGMYSAVMMFGRIIYFFTTALVMVLLPYVSIAYSQGQNPKQVLIQSLLFTLVAAVLCMTPINLFPSFFIELIYGEKYLAGISYLPLSSAIALLFSLINLELNFYVGIGKSKKVFADFMISILALIVFILWHHSTALEILAEIFIVLLLLFFYELMGCLLQKAESHS